MGAGIIYLTIIGIIYINVIHSKHAPSAGAGIGMITCFKFPRAPRILTSRCPIHKSSCRNPGYLLGASTCISAPEGWLSLLLLLSLMLLLRTCIHASGFHPQKKPTTSKMHPTHSSHNKIEEAVRRRTLLFATQRAQRSAATSSSEHAAHCPACAVSPAPMEHAPMGAVTFHPQKLTSCSTLIGRELGCHRRPRICLQRHQALMRKICICSCRCMELGCHRRLRICLQWHQALTSKIYIFSRRRASCAWS